jgi:hypothetical protein
VTQEVRGLALSQAHKVLLKSGPAVDMAVHPSHQFLAMAAQKDRYLRIWDLALHAEVRRYLIEEAPEDTGDDKLAQQVDPLKVATEPFLCLFPSTFNSFSLLRLPLCLLSSFS